MKNLTIRITVSDPEAIEALKSLSKNPQYPLANIRYLFADALHDFVTVRERGDAEKYVETRYAGEYPAGFREAKVIEVNSRFEAARILHNPVLGMEVYETEVDEN